MGPFAGGVVSLFHDGLEGEPGRIEKGPQSKGPDQIGNDKPEDGVDLHGGGSAKHDPKTNGYLAKLENGKEKYPPFQRG